MTETWSSAGLTLDHHVLTGAPQHPGAELIDEAALLGQCDETGRWHGAQLCAVPAGQGLDAATGADNASPIAWCSGQEFALVVHADLSAFQAAPQQAVHMCACQRRLCHLGAVEMEAVAAGALGLVHGSVGRARQLVGAAAVAGVERNADAGRDLYFVPLQFHHAGQGTDQLVGHQRGLQRRVLAFEHANELVAAQASQQIAAPQVRSQATRHFDQQVVTDRVPERVIDLLELIKVQEEHSQLPLLALRLGDGITQMVIAQQAVGQASQRVVMCQMLEPGQGGAQLFGARLHTLVEHTVGLLQGSFLAPQNALGALNQQQLQAVQPQHQGETGQHGAAVQLSQTLNEGRDILVQLNHAWRFELARAGWYRQVAADQVDHGALPFKGIEIVPVHQGAGGAAGQGRLEAGVVALVLSDLRSAAGVDRQALAVVELDLDNFGSMHQRPRPSMKVLVHGTQLRWLAAGATGGQQGPEALAKRIDEDRGHRLVAALGHMNQLALCLRVHAQG